MFSLTLITQSFAGHLDQRQLAAFSIATTVIISITFGFLLIGQPTLLAELTGEVAMWLIPMHLNFVFQFTLMRFLQCQLKTYVIAWVSGVASFYRLWDFFKLALASGVMLSLENFYYRILVIVSGIRSAEVAVDALSICISFYGWESMIPLGLFAATGMSLQHEIFGKINTESI
ncbi:protein DETOXIFICATION 27 [Sesamum angolense]|uniref:Protein DETOXIFICATION 27 n=1 Tax=Sesamum angolense TaxID=2727404 RepID=A0AAE1T442_9LAMI|nr:protein DETOXIFICATION 27 [Sesamum angolense]